MPKGLEDIPLTLFPIYEINMRVFKFGGASVQNAENIKNAINIVLKCKDQNTLVIIVSAIGKTTNALEKVAEAFFSGNQEEALNQFEAIKNDHKNIAHELLENNLEECQSQMLDLFTEVEWLLHDEPVRDFGYYYDQIVCIGELLSTTIFSFAMRAHNCENAWLDVRDVLRTDNTHREAIVDWKITKEKVNATIHDLELKTNIIVTQGFIGATDDNESTTLGREGSDFTAAIFSNVLNATSLTIWKDVDGVMNADPKLFSNAMPIRHLDYEEVVEMAYYGAQVIHPKTIKPLYSKKIPLFVKCFWNTDLEGTRIDEKKETGLPPIYILKKNQVLFTLRTKDLSFVSGKPLIKLYEIMQSLLIKPNMIHIGAITIDICINNESEKREAFEKLIFSDFKISSQNDLTLTSIRHYHHTDVDAFVKDFPQKFLEQKDEKVWQFLS